MGESKKREVRYMAGEQFQPKIRESENGGESRIIEGYAIVFGVVSRMLVDYWDDYREIIEPGAITEDDLKRMDIKMTLWHNREKLIARWNKGEGSLSLSIDDLGVRYRFAAPMTPDGDTALELVKRGDLAGSSFIYWSDESSSVRYTKDDDGVLIRHVVRIDEIFDMTIASDPAYTQTSVTAREIEASGITIDAGRKKREEETKRNETAYMDLRKIANKKIF